MTLAHPKYWSLGTKLPATLAIVTMAVAVTIGLALVAQERERQRSDLAYRARLTVRSIAANAGDPMLRSDYWTLYRILRQVAAGGSHEAEGVLSAYLVDKAGHVVAHLDPRAHPIGLQLRSDDATELARIAEVLASQRPAVTWLGGDAVEAAFPVRANQSFLGMAVVRFSAAEIGTRMWSASFIILGIALTLSMIGSAIGAFISNRMVRPLRQLAEAMGRISASDDIIAPKVALKDHDEIGQLVQSFNRMSADLAHKRILEQEAATSEKLVALGRIAAGVAHEVNNPLSGMLNCVDTLDRHRDDASILDRYLPLLRKGLVRIHGIVQSLLVELRAEGAHELGGGACLDDVRDLIAAEIGERPITLVWHNQLQSDACLYCTRTQQVVLNLMRNAVQAMPDGGVVRFHAYQEAAEAVIVVEDNGEGIPREHMSQLFDPFFTSRPHGTGLGLWITYRLVQSMRGRIVVESERGVGTTFRLYLPRAKEAQ